MPERIDAIIRLLFLHADAADLAVVASVAAAHAFELRVVEAHHQLVDEVAAYHPDAVVLDVMQPGIRGDGYDLCLGLKVDPRTSSVPVILLGSLDGPEARSRAFTAGCDDFLEKPVNRHALAYRLRSFARLRRAWARNAVEVLRKADHDGHLDPELLARFARELG